jgi:hypothetical protein
MGWRRREEEKILCDKDIMMSCVNILDCKLEAEFWM